jgi:ankyrin repeat protein
VSSSILGHRLSHSTLCRFRWVYCQLEVLQHCFGSSIRQTLEQLPETLDDTYVRVLSQIPPVNRENAHRMLQCLMVAVRPLRVEELAELLAFEFGTAQVAVPKYRADWRPNDQVQAVQSTCSSLISIVGDNDSQIVQFSHFSVKEFLMSNRLTSSLGDFSQYQILPRPAHTILAQACLGYLLHLNGHVVDERIVKDFPLAEYAAKHWVTHAQFEDVASHVKDGMETLFDCDKPHFATWLRIYNMDGEFYSESPSKIPTPLYYSSLCGFSDLVEHLSTKHPQHVNAIGGMYKFPLLAALIGNHTQVAEILLKHGANVDIRGLRDRTPLHEAIANVGMVQSLLGKGADVNCRQNGPRTPLHLAACYGELKVARALVEHKANVNSRDKEGKTPLHLLLEASRRDNDDILDLARFLLEHRTDVNIRTTSGWTLLHEVAVKGKLEIVRLLLDYGAYPNAENDEGETPLHLVLRSRQYDRSQERRVSIVRQLLVSGVDVNARQKDGWTSLHWAAFTGRVEVAQVLFDHGANAKLETEGGETALHTVSRGEFDSQEQGVSTARLLLERGVDVNAREKYGRTSLHYAAFEGRVEVAQVLLDHGANANLETNVGETALHLVSRGEYNFEEHGVGIARMLLEHGVDVHARNKFYATALHLAAFRGRPEIVQLLLDHGANPNAENEKGRTPLDSVTRGKYKSREHGVSIARLLLELGVNANAQDNNKFTPLHWATFYGKFEIVQVCLFFQKKIPFIIRDDRYFLTAVQTQMRRTMRARPRCT